MLTKEQVVAEKKRLKLLPPQSDLYTTIYEGPMTCDECPSNDDCRWAFDAYNTDGDCLAIK